MNSQPRRERARFHWILLLVVCWCSGLEAAVNLELYRERALVVDQSPEERLRILPEALARVVDRVSGSGDWRIAVDPAELEEAAPRFLEEFRYERLPEVPGMVTAPPAAAQSGADTQGGIVEQPLQFEVFLRFAEPAVNQWLTERGIGVWTRSRPDMIAWIGIENGGRRELVGEGAEENARRDLEAAADYWGLPLRLPLLDLQDRTTVTPSDLWGFFGDSVMDASERYGANIVLMAKQYRRAGRSVVQWQLRDTRRVLDAGETEERDPGAARRAMLAQVAASLSRRFAVVEDLNEQGSLRVEVSELRTYWDYGRCQNLLETLAPVKSVRPIRVTGSRVLWQVELSGTQAQFEEYLALNSKVRALPGAPGDAIEGRVPDLLYRWSDQ